DLRWHAMPGSGKRSRGIAGAGSVVVQRAGGRFHLGACMNSVLLRNRLQTAGAIAALGMPVAYIVKKHVDWEKTPDGKKRMLIHHLTFWSAAASALLLMHRTLRKFRRKPFLSFKLPRLAIAGLLLPMGFEGGERLARFLAPKKPLPSAASRPVF